MKKKLMVGLLLAGSTLFAGPRISVGVGFGAPAGVVAQAPVVSQEFIPPCPGPNYVWVSGYYGADGAWYQGYWNYVPPPVVIAPRVELRGGFDSGFGRDYGRAPIVETHRGGSERGGDRVGNNNHAGDGHGRR